MGRRRLLLLLPLLLAAGGGAAVGFAAALAITPERLTVVQVATTVPVSSCTLAASSADSYVDEGNRGANFGTATELRVRSQQPGNGDRRTFVRFDLASCSIPGTARITSASLSLYLATAPAASRTYDVHRVAASWGETTITWNNQPSVASTATASTTTGTTSGVRLQWNVAADVQSFVSGTSTNYGWRVFDQNEGTGTAESVFSSREHGTASQRPTLTISYYP